MARSEAPARRKLPETATPIVLPPPRQSSTLPDVRREGAKMLVVVGRTDRKTLKA